MAGLFYDSCNTAEILVIKSFGYGKINVECPIHFFRNMSVEPLNENVKDIALKSAKLIFLKSIPFHPNKLCTYCVAAPVGYFFVSAGPLELLKK